jgi:hypothetical protein
MATLIPTRPSLQQKDYSREETDRLWNEIQRLNLEAKRKGTLIGRVLNFHAVDNYARYIIANDNPLTVEHIPFGDGYTVHAALIRGLNVDDVKEMLGVK